MDALSLGRGLHTFVDARWPNEDSGSFKSVDDMQKLISRSERNQALEA